MPEVTFGGVPGWLLAAYLEELGGMPIDAHTIRGDGWTATLFAHERPAGSLAVGHVTVALSGPRGEAILEILRRKAMRGGG